MTDEEALPEVLRQVADEISMAVALQLAAELGGTRIWVPEQPQPDSALVKAVGQQAAERICRLIGPGKITIPLGPTATYTRRAQRIQQLLEQGLSHSAIARRLNVHIRTVERHAGQRDPRQRDLFEAG